MVSREIREQLLYERMKHREWLFTGELMKTTTRAKELADIDRLIEYARDRRDQAIRDLLRLEQQRRKVLEAIEAAMEASSDPAKLDHALDAVLAAPPKLVVICPHCDGTCREPDVGEPCPPCGHCDGKGEVAEEEPDPLEPPKFDIQELAASLCGFARGLSLKPTEPKAAVDEAQHQHAERWE
jgi:rubrerythrin